MSKTLIKNIGLLAGITDKTELRGTEMNTVECIQDAWLLAEDGIISAFGPMTTLPEVDAEIHDAQGSIVMPCFCDSHTHIVWGGDRSGEFRDKIDGLSYEEIAARGGGILNSADTLAATSENTLFEQAARRLRQMRDKGTLALEIKSGYGLTLQGELKSLRVIKRLKEYFPEIAIKTTFLAAHAVARGWQQPQYVDYVIREMLPACGPLAEYIDVFCDKEFFTPEQTERIICAGAKTFGLKAKIHANELACSGGVEVGVKHGAVSVDHLENAGPVQIALLAQSSTVATMLPGASFFSNLPYGHAREAIEKGCVLALASDYNPGSSPCADMHMIWGLGCIKMRLTPEQAFNAVTINGAAAMGLANRRGSIAPGRDLAIIRLKPHINSLAYIPYSYAEDIVEELYV